MHWRVPICALWLWSMTACSDEANAPVTEVAVNNLSDMSVDVTVSDGQAKLSFEDVAATTTSSYQTADFESYADVEVTVGDDSQQVDLHAGQRNIVAIGPDAGVVSVRRAAPKSGGKEGGW